MGIETEAVKVIQQKIDDNKASLVSGLNFNGIPVALDQISRSHATPPRTFPYITLEVGESAYDGKATNKPTGRDYLNVTIVLENHLVHNTDDSEAYELSHDCHRDLGDNVKGLFVQACENGEVFNGDSKRFKIVEDQRIVKRNSGAEYQDQQGYHVQLESTIEFQIRSC